MITSGYATRANFKSRLMEEYTYTATTISFASTTKSISDTAKGLKRFPTGAIVTVSGSTSNDGTYTVAVGDAADKIVINESLTTEIAGDTVIVTDVSDPADDLLIDVVITSVSRLIDTYCHRRFYQNSTDEIRYYTTQWSDLCFTDDIGSVTSLKTDDDGDRTYGTTWAVTDYDLCPANASADGGPYTYLELAPNGDYAFPTGRRGVYLCGKFGYASTAPTPIQEACLIQSIRIFKRKEAPFGVTGANAFGQSTILTSIDPDVKMLLEPFVRRVAA